MMELGLPLLVGCDVFRAQKLNQFVMDHFNDLLARMNAEKDLLPHGFGFHSLNEIASDLEIDISV